jgi:putative AlgH/UPF0301 family transcriptional regulator
MEALAAGILLIADPFLQDPNFKRSVIFLCDHKEEGSFGFVLNRARAGPLVISFRRHLSKATLIESEKVRSFGEEATQ